MKYHWPKHSSPLSSAFIEAFRWREPLSPAVWIEQNFRLTTAYALPGKIKLFAWQREIVDAIVKYLVVIVIAPVQIGKSMLAEAISAYLIDNYPMNMMFCYHKRELVQDVFDERLKPMIREIPAMANYWSGDDDDLTKRRIKLAHLIIRIASAVTKTDIATFNAGFVYGAEFAKYPDKDFNQIKMLFGRQQASRMLGRTIKALLETSPRNDTDKSYIEAHKTGVLFLRPHYPCPHCKRYQFLTDRQIKEIPNKKKQKDHNPARIRAEKAAYYECKHCKKRISEDARYEFAGKVVWAAVDDKRDVTIEKIDRKGKIKARIKTDRVVFQLNRLVDVTWSFAECLAAYFEALNSPNPEDLQTYRNEDMGEWVQTRSRRYAESFILSKCQRYYQYGSHAYVPDGVAVLLLGVDTQDTGFYFVVRGFGKNLESWLVRADFIVCDMKDSIFQNPANVAETFTKELYRYGFKKRDNTSLDVYWGFIDRGGHRAGDVDYITSHNPRIESYIGSTAKTAQLIAEKDSGHYFGNTENLSKMVQKNLESDIWHLPRDIQPDYCTQVVNEFAEVYTDSKGHSKRRWVTVDPNHYRSCENMIAAAVIQTELREMLFDESTVKRLQDTKPTETTVTERQEGVREEVDSDYFAGRTRW